MPLHLNSICEKLLKRRILKPTCITTPSLTQELALSGVTIFRKEKKIKMITSLYCGLGLILRSGVEKGGGVEEHANLYGKQSKRFQVTVGGSLLK